MNFQAIKSKVYIKTDGQGRILLCEGGYTTPKDLAGWIYIDEGTGDRYNLCQSHYFSDGLYTADGIPLYRWDGKQIIPRAEEEMENDRKSIPPFPPSELEQLRADVDFIAALEGVSL